MKLFGWGLEKAMVENFCVFKGEADNAISIMREVAQWCEVSGKNMWRPEALSKDRLMKDLSEENFCVGKFGDDNASSMILQWYDPLFWPEKGKDESGYVHKLCVRRKYSGQGVSHKMIEYAVEECKKKGVHFLRLDTGWNRQRLCELYESMGFIKVGKRTIGGWEYALYEMSF